MPLDLIHLLDYVGLAVFAVSGALAAGDKRLDILGFILFATITGVGGGTFRDLLLGVEIFWIANHTYVWICVAAAIATWFFATSFHSLHKPLIWMDAAGLAVFAVLGTEKALSLDVPVVVAIGMGMMTASFGSLIRDTLLQRDVVLLEPDIYVTAALLGAACYALLDHFKVASEIALWVSVMAAFGLRALAIVLQLRLPRFNSSSGD